MFLHLKMYFIYITIWEVLLLKKKKKKVNFSHGIKYTLKLFWGDDLFVIIKTIKIFSHNMYYNNLKQSLVINRKSWQNAIFRSNKEIQPKIFFIRQMINTCS
jgi:hypothetical protein